MSNAEIISAYRKLLRAALRAVQFSKPARYIVTKQIRVGFRDKMGTFDPEAIKRTAWFLNAAAQERGLEHKILKNLTRIHWEKSEADRLTWTAVQQLGERKKQPPPDQIKETRYKHYEATIAMLNDTMGLCLR
ncbi:DUF1763-domain-containing protein [Thozetella sp. PMI_491]|nr:DUF1763-domain-containing protein [Thozetella sp. PMI_491]